MSINSDLLRQARELKLNVSKAAEEWLVKLVCVERERQVRAELAESFRAYNEHVEKHGVFNDGIRTFGV